MCYYIARGSIPHKRHTRHIVYGRLAYEEVFGTEGFSGTMSTIYYRNPPTAVERVEIGEVVEPTYVEQRALRMRHLRAGLIQPEGDPITGRKVLLGNSDVEISLCVPAQRMPTLYKNGQADECLYIQRGSGTLTTLFGRLAFEARDFVVIPKGTIYRLDSEMPGVRYLTMEFVNGSHVQPPKRYRQGGVGQFLENSPYCERDIRAPDGPFGTPDDARVNGEYEVCVKARGAMHRYTYTHDPMDIVGYDGVCWPYAFNAMDFAPIVGQVHLPPPVHQVFEGHNVVICAFCPRPLDFHPNAVRVPYAHSNIDSDAVMFYAEGNYTARRGIEECSITLHPLGIPHGPHPGTIEATTDQRSTDELAVMCDTFRPLYPTQYALGIEDPDYAYSWKVKRTGQLAHA
ncbi:MAG: homogentisate 1,2-dioxygenase [Phycisphaerales bacterium]|nr:homogentisate 1,2-dioxygenase [Phycisphaerales bacterium]